MAKTLKSQLKVEKKDRIIDGSFKTNKAGTYYLTYIDNIYPEVMKPEHSLDFLNGDGNELVSKACAVASSSMLAYNFFHWVDSENPFKIAGGVYNHVNFERQFPCVKGRKKANMDVVLTDDAGNMLCIECKFTEHLKDDKCEIAEAYSDPSKTSGIDWRKLVEKYRTADWYQGGLKQNISHLVALNRFVKEENINPDKIKFINVIFQPKEKPFEVDFGHDKKYRDELEQLKKDINKMVPGLQVNLDQVMTYREIFDAMKANAPAGLIEYLKKRYMKYHK